MTDKGAFGVFKAYARYQGWDTTTPITPDLFDGDTTHIAMRAWDVYSSLPDNFTATPEQARQDAFTAAWDAATKVARA